MTAAPSLAERQRQIFADVLAPTRRVSLRDHLREIDPGPWLDWWHVGRMMEATQALMDGEIENLAVAAPPRTWKSRICIQGLASACLRADPREKIKVVCAADDLVEFHSRHIRDHVQAVGVELRGDSRAVKTWETAAGGLFKAETIGALRKGFGWGVGLMDDPFKSREDARRVLVQRKAWRGYRDDYLDRREARAAGGPGVQLLMHQRLDRGDLWGRLMDWLREDGVEEWTILVLKGYAERVSVALPPQCHLVEDDRAPGEPLCESKDLMREIAKRRRTDPGLHRAQDQQDPEEISSGGVYCGPWIRIVDPESAFAPPALYRGWDFSTGSGADSTASAKGGPDRRIDDELCRWRWLDVTEAKVPSASIEGLVLDTAAADGPGVEVVLPNEVAMGKAFSDRLAARLIALRFTAHVYPQREPKRARALPHAAMAAAVCSACHQLLVPPDSAELFAGRGLCACESPGGDGYGRVDFVRAAWNEPARAQLHAFTGNDGGHDDTVDAMSVAVNVGMESAKPWSVYG